MHLFSKWLSRAVTAGVALLFLLTSAADPVGAAAGGTRRSTLHRYVVVLHDDRDAASVATDHAARYGARVRYVYRRVLHGYAATMTAKAVRSVRRDAAVAAVETDRRVGLHDVAVVRTAGRPRTAASSLPWGLDRIDQAHLPLDGAYAAPGDGTGVTAYVIDTGIRVTHQDFGGRARVGFDATGGDGHDCHGHGTHVAGTLGGARFGVAKRVSIVAVRVLGCDGHGLVSSVIAGVEWVTTNHRPGQPAVANMSVGGMASTALDRAVSRSISDGVTYAVAAGNSGGDACSASPARVAGALTVAAADRTDSVPAWSDHGPCVDWYAPGVAVTSDWITSDRAQKTLSGTSMATPHTAGAAAIYLQHHPAASAAQVAAALAGAASPVIPAPPGTTHALLRVVP